MVEDGRPGACSDCGWGVCTSEIMPSPGIRCDRLDPISEWRDVGDGPPRMCRPFCCHGSHEIVVPALLVSRDIGVGRLSTDID